MEEAVINNAGGGQFAYKSYKKGSLIQTNTAELVNAFRSPSYI